MSDQFLFHASVLTPARVRRERDVALVAVHRAIASLDPRSATVEVGLLTSLRAATPSGLLSAVWCYDFNPTRLALTLVRFDVRQRRSRRERFRASLRDAGGGPLWLYDVDAEDGSVLHAHEVPTPPWVATALGDGVARALSFHR